MLTLLITVCIIAGLVFSEFRERESARTRELVHEQIHLIVNSLDKFRVVNQIDHITKAVYSLVGVSEVKILDNTCEVLRSQPINFSSDWKCGEKPTGATLLYLNKNIFGQSAGAPFYIVVKLGPEKNFFETNRFLSHLLTIIALLCFVFLMLVMAIRYLVVVPTLRIGRLIESGNRFGLQDLSLGGFPSEFQPIISGVVERDQKIEDSNQRIIKSEKSEAIISITNQVVHDVRSPLGSIRVALKFLKTKPDEASGLIQRAFDRIDNILSDLERSSRDTSEPNRKPFTLYSSLANLVDEKRVEYHSRAVAIEIFAEGRLKTVQVAVEESGLQRVVSNIINNSIEASGDSDVTVEISLTMTTNGLAICISDDGPGVPKSIGPRIFEDGFSAGKSEGRGLGLSAAQKYVKSFHGSLELDKDFDEGARFTLVVPNNQVVKD